MVAMAPGAHVPAEADADGRAVDGPGADPRRAQLRDHQAGARGRASPSSSSSRTRTSRSRSPTAATCSRRAGSSSRARRPTCSQDENLRKAYLGRCSRRKRPLSAVGLRAHDASSRVSSPAAKPRGRLRRIVSARFASVGGTSGVDLAAGSRGSSRLASSGPSRDVGVPTGRSNRPRHAGRPVSSGRRSDCRASRGSSRRSGPASGSLQVDVRARRALRLGERSPARSHELGAPAEACALGGEFAKTARAMALLGVPRHSLS